MAKVFEMNVDELRKWAKEKSQSYQKKVDSCNKAIRRLMNEGYYDSADREECLCDTYESLVSFLNELHDEVLYPLYEHPDVKFVVQEIRGNITPSYVVKAVKTIGDNYCWKAGEWVQKWTHEGY